MTLFYDPALAAKSPAPYGLVSVNNSRTTLGRFCSEEVLAVAPPPSDEVLGVVLAGGLGRRLGGAKAQRLLAGRPLLTHVLDRLMPQLAPGRLMLNINGDASAFAAYGLPIIPDTIAGRPGPLAGILAAMLGAGAGAAWVLTAPTDTPFLPPDLVNTLMSRQRETGVDIVLANSQAGLCQVCGLWSVGLASALADRLAIGQNTVLDFAERHAHSSVPFPPQWLGRQSIDPFFNINTADDLAIAERMLTV